MIPTIDLRRESAAHPLELPHLPELTGAAIETWRARMVNEFSSSYVFDRLAKQMQIAGFSADEVSACECFANEERKHGVLCGAVVRALGGEAVAPHLDQDEFPMHPEVSHIEGVLRNLLSISCMSETVAVALIGAERLEMPEGPLRDLLTTIWADEIGHAKFGWRILSNMVPNLSINAKRRLNEYVPLALAALEAHELAHLPNAPAISPDGAQLGLCSGQDARVLLYETIEEAILPPLRALGLTVDKAWRREQKSAS